MTEIACSVQNVRMLHLGYFTGPANRVFSRTRRSDECQMIVVTGGLYVATVDTPRGRERIRAQAGDVVLWPAHSEDTDESVPNQPLRCVNIFLRWPQPPPDLPFLVRDSDHLVDRLTHRLLAIAHDPAGKALPGDAANACLAAMLVEFVALAHAGADPLLRRVADYTEQNIDRPIRLEELARHVGLEKNHFGRTYKARTGRTPIEDVQRRKALYAKYMLQETPERTLQNLAGYVGVRNAATLSRLLARHAGISARDIKKAAREECGGAHG